MRKRPFLVEVLFVTFWLIAIFVALPHFCKGLAYSIFYQQNPDKLNELIVSEKQRASTAYKTLAGNNYKFLLDKTDKIDKTNNNTDLCIVIPTYTRIHNQQSYLPQTLASFVDQLIDTKLSYVFTVYNARGTDHNEAYNIAKYLPVVHNTTISSWAKERNEFEIQKVGYTSAMRWCSQKNAHFNLVIDDDVILDKSFMKKLSFVLNFCLADKLGKKWGLMKLYTPEKLQGWLTSPTNVVELAMFTSLIGFLIAYLSVFICIGPMTLDKRHCKVTFKYPTMYFRILFSHVCVLLVLLSLGRPHWEELRKLNALFISVVETKTRCCSPVSIYPRTHFKDMIKFLESRKTSVTFTHEHVIDQFMEERDLSKLMVVPNLGNHIGRVSTMSIKEDIPASEFELLFPP